MTRFLRGKRAVFRRTAAYAVSLVVAICCFATTALSQAPSGAAPDDSPRFDIRRFVFEGASLIPLQRLTAATQQFTGEKRQFSDVQRALETVERLYSESGYSAVQVVLPEQELERGEIRFVITEAKIGRVIVEGNKFFDEANVRASIPALVAGRAPNINEIARNLRIANDNPAKQSNVLLRSGQEEATVDAVVRVVDEKPERFSVTIDNTGTRRPTGDFRVGLGYQHSNVRNSDHVLTLQYVGAPHEQVESTRLSVVPSRNVFVIGAGYRVPLYRSGDSLEVTAGYSNVNSGTVANLFSITGAGGILGARYTRNLERLGDYEHRLTFGLEHRGYHNKGVRALGTTQQIIVDVAVLPFTILYSGQLRRQDSETGGTFGFSHNIPGGRDATRGLVCLSRTSVVGDQFECANARYLIWRWGFNHNQALSGDWQWRLAMSGQWTKDMLISGEQFGAGGADSVRGFLEREITNDTGYRGTLEMYSPDFGARLPFEAGRARWLAFVDWAGLKRNRPGSLEPHATHIGSAGVGVRLSRGNNMTFRVDFAQVFDEGGLQGRGDGRAHASFSYIF